MLLRRLRRVVGRRYSLRLVLCGRRCFLLATRLLLGLNARLRLLRLMRMGLLSLRTLPALVPAVGCNHTVIMLGMLEEVFCSDPVPSRQRVLRQGLVFLDDLKGGSTNLTFRTVALEG